MAIGDVIGSLRTISVNEVWEFQPSSGSIVLVTNIFSDQWTGTSPNKKPDMIVGVTDGSYISQCRTTGEICGWDVETRMFIDNTFYLYIKNGATATATIGFTGIIWDE